MTLQWKINTYGDPLGAVRLFVHTIWEKAGLDGLIFSLQADAQPAAHRDASLLKNFNPFKPVMAWNAAGFIPDILCKHPGMYLGAILRPCEMRALKETLRIAGIAQDRLLTICLDCLGTYPMEEYRWRVARKGSQANLADDTLRFARQGGIAAYRFRSACQMCASPAAAEADINLGVIGFPVRRFLLMSTNQDTISVKLQLETFADGKPDVEALEGRQQTLTRLTGSHFRTQERLMDNLGRQSPTNIHELRKHFESCSSCTACMENCPICALAFPRREEAGLYLEGDLILWLAACAGCGMCEQACPHNLPLNAIFSSLRNTLTN